MKDHTRLPTLSEIKIYLKSFDFFTKYVHGQWEGDLYVENHARRFLATLRALPPLPPNARVLEVGAIPYYMTIMLRKICGFQVDPLSFFEAGEHTEATIHVVKSTVFAERYEFSYQPINVERDIFPGEDDQYDLVLCCEILEHLLINPSHMLYEIHRVLRPNGRLLITTPNVLRWGNAVALAKGVNIYDRYHGNGIYGRHNREYSPAEVELLLESNAFCVEWNKTINVYGSELLNKLPHSFINRGDNIFTLAQARDRPKMSFPSELYVLMDQYRNTARSLILIGRDDPGQIGSGWYDFEADSPGFRWTSARAEFRLKNQIASQLLKIRLRSDNPEIERLPVIIKLAVNGEEQDAAKLTDRSWQDVAFKLKEHDATTILDCRIEISRTWIPGAADNRVLGVAVNRIWLE